MTSTFELNAAVGLEEVGDIRRFVYALQRRWTSDRDLRERVMLAAHELLENAAKYASDGRAWFRIEANGAELTIRTRNRASAQNAIALAAVVSALASTDDAMGFYVELMGRAGRGGLGLGRVAAECEMSVRCSVVDDVVEIEARTRGAA